MANQNSIKFMSRFDMKKLLHSAAYDENTAFISISDTRGEWDEMTALFQSSGSPFLSLYFSDVEKGEKGAMTDDHANDILQFINEHHNKIFYVHCFLGISRSGAIAKWINDYLDRGIFYLEDYKGYNRHVYDMMDRVIGNSMSAYYESLEKQNQ